MSEERKSSKDKCKNTPFALNEMGKDLLYKKLKNKKSKYEVVEDESVPKKIKVEVDDVAILPKSEPCNSNLTGAGLKFPATPYRPPQKDKAFQKWTLSSKTDLRAGVIDNNPVLRVSTAPDLTEKRPCPPELIKSGAYTETVHDENGKRILSETIFLNCCEVRALYYHLETIINMSKKESKN